MFETSLDFLNIVKAVSLFGFVAFACWAIYYFAMILRQGYLIIKEMRDRIHKVDELIKSLKDKIDHSTSYLMLISEGVKKLVEVIKDRTEKREEKKK